MPATEPTQFEFEADIKQLLDIVVHSLYTDKEVFVRELVSNASDALEKLRHLQLTQEDINDRDLPLEINVTTDPEAKTLTIEDSGVGMTRDELVENLGTIARSGSRAFLENLRDAAASRTALIGQFGVGFYSAFMVASQVRVYTQSWRPGEGAFVWTSDGGGSYEVAETHGQRRGTRIVLALTEEAADFASDWKLREILARYSAFIAFPINLNGDRINTVDALWLRHGNATSDDEYAAFYKFQAHAYDEPRLRLHFRADAPLSVNVLVFVPQHNPEKAGLPRTEASVALYSRRVLIDAHPRDLVPKWLRFLTGVVDSEDLPLNISRESTQNRSLIAKLRSLLTVRFLRFLEEEATHHPESYDAFYEEFGRYLKEGVALDFAQRDHIARLLRYESSATASGTTTSLGAYVSRMPAEQTEIYYLLGPSRTAIEHGPYLEGFKARDFEVLYCYEPVDEYVMSTVRTFEGKPIVAGDHADVKLPKPASASTIDETLDEAETRTLIDWMRTVLDDRIADITASDRLTDSPVLVVSTDPFVSPHMRRIMRSMNRPGGDAQVRVKLEINPRHAVIRRLFATHATNPETASLVAQQLLDNGLLSAGLLDDPTSMVARLNRLLEHVGQGR